MDSEQKEDNKESERREKMRREDNDRRTAVRFEDGLGRRSGVERRIQ